MRRTRINPRNDARRAKAYARDYGTRGEAVRAMACLCAGSSCFGPIEADHTPTRGAGGGRRDLVPLCRSHHREKHDTGVVTFQAKYRINLRDEAARIAEQLDEQGHE